MKGLLIRSLLTWIGFLALAFSNGALRELGLKKYLGVQEPLAHQLSCLTGTLMWTVFLLLIWNRLKIEHLKHAIWVGMLWFVLTFSFETFVLNRHLAWVDILKTYDIRKGEYWGMGLLWIGVMPMVVYITKHRDAD